MSLHKHECRPIRCRIKDYSLHSVNAAYTDSINNPIICTMCAPYKYNIYTKNDRLNKKNKISTRSINLVGISDENRYEIKS